MVRDGSHILGVLYFITWCILMIFFSQETPGCFGHFVFMCNSLIFLFHMDNILFYFSTFLISFNRKIMQVCEDIMGIGSWKSFHDLLMRHQTQLSIYFDGICLLSMEDYAPFAFLVSWVLVTLYL